MPDFFFNSEIPDFSFEIPPGTKEITLTLNDISDVPYLVFSQSYRPSGGLLEIAGLGTVVAAHLSDIGRPAADYAVSVAIPASEGAAPQILQKKFSAVLSLSPYRTNANEWIVNNFLTDAKTIRLPHDFALPLSVAFVSDIAGPGSVPVAHDGPGLVTVSGDARKARFLFLPDDMVRPTVFRFQNSFGVPEYAAFYGVTSISPSQESSQVTVSGIRRKVDCSTDDTMTLTASNIPQDWAMAAHALLHARRAWLVDDYTSPDSSLTEIIVESVDGDIADSLTELCSVKIKYRPAMTT